ncbi:MAG TPA: SIMPL domain-containing protein [Stellaceae bacterium]|nr:SIMPL domain-containing protein [Stellaceae bacterium]
MTETAQRDVPRDLLHATLAAEASDADATKVQAAINQRMAAALVRAKQVPNIDIETAGYSVYRDNPDKTPAQWHGSQSVTVTGKDFAALLDLVGVLQRQGLVMQNLSPDLSRDARQSVEDALTNEALTRLRQRADRIAATLNSKVSALRSIDVGNVNPPPPMFRVMTTAAPAAAAPMPQPVAEAGSATVSVTVTADIALSSQ